MSKQHFNSIKVLSCKPLLATATTTKRGYGWQAQSAEYGRCEWEEVCSNWKKVKRKFGS